MRVLVVNPGLVRFEALGACEQDRLTHIHDLVRLGHEVRLLARINPYQRLEQAEQYYRERAIPAQVLPALTQRWVPARFRDPAFLDGAAWVYGAPDFLQALAAALEQWQPDLVWCHGSYLWAPARFASGKGLPTVVRSVNYEPDQFEEYASSLGNRLRYFGKRFGERHATTATVLAAITPVEQARYQQINPRANVQLLPLRTLPALLRRTPRPAAAEPLRVFFMGASYNVPHNSAALAFITDQLVPLLRTQAPGSFEFHILGSKIPERFRALAAPDLVFAGYVPDLDAYLSQMDIALAPWLFGVGMQQKVFEPLCRGFPTITHAQALAGYPFEDGVHVILAATAAEYADALLRLRDATQRQQLGSRALERAEQLFSRQAMDVRIEAILQAALAGA